MSRFSALSCTYSCALLDFCMHNCVAKRLIRRHESKEGSPWKRENFIDVTGALVTSNRLSAATLTIGCAWTLPSQDSRRCFAGPRERQRFKAVFTRPTCENACGKLPTRQRLCGSYSSDKR